MAGQKTLLWICLIGSCVSLSMCVTKKALERGRQILVFGGNGFMGSATMERFIMNGDNITMVNRGNWYWDSFNRIKPYVTHISCDRKNGIESCVGLVKAVEEIDSYDAVIDFSAYDANETKDAGALLQGKVKLYILISTDSIYDVCEKGHDEKTKESDDTRPSDAESVHLNIIHDYGHRKKRAEEELFKHHKEQGFPIVVLRLPDVIGPRDTTFRWWIYQLWVKLSSKLTMKPITTPEFLRDYHMSLVYSEDVAKLLFDLLVMDDEIHNQVYNIALDETVTLVDIIRVIQKELGVDDLDISEEKNHTETLYLYPSVRRGPINTTKAKKILEWQPTPFTEAAAEVVKFYEEAMKGDVFGVQKDEVIQATAMRLFPKSKIKFYTALEDAYEISLNHFLPKDEL